MLTEFKKNTLQRGEGATQLLMPLAPSLLPPQNIVFLFFQICAKTESRALSNAVICRSETISRVVALGFKNTPGGFLHSSLFYGGVLERFASTKKHEKSTQTSEIIKGE